MAKRDGEAALLAQVYAAPDDDAPRLVYADWLQERSDPRGELIALQIERARGKARSGGRKREDALLQKHGAGWARPLAARKTPQVDIRLYGAHWLNPAVHFERGFADHVRSWLYGDSATWSTVRSSTAAPRSDRCFTTALRTITAGRDTDILALAKLTKPLAVEELAWEHGYHPSRPSYDQVSNKLSDAFAQIRVLSLQRLHLGFGAVGPRPDPASLAWAWESPASSALATLRVPGHDLRAWCEALAPTHVGRVELVWVNYQPSIIVRIERDKKRAFRKLTLAIHRSTREGLALFAQQLGRFDKGGLSSVRVAIGVQAEWDKSGSERATLTRVCKNRGIDVAIEKVAPPAELRL